MDAAGGLLTAWMKPEMSSAFRKTMCSASTAIRWDWIAQWISREGLGQPPHRHRARSLLLFAKAHARLTAGLPNAKFHDADLLVNWIRAVKTKPEIEYLRKASLLAQAAVSKAYEVIAPGVRECDAIAQIQGAQVAGSPDFAGDITALSPTILGGENASAPHIMWSDRRFGANETIALELAGVCRRYAAGLARTMQLGKTPQRVADTAKAVIEGMDAVLAATKPGILAEDVEAAWRKVIERYGLKKESRIGYSIGVAYRPIGASIRSACAPATRRCWSPAMWCIASSACGWRAGA